VMVLEASQHLGAGVSSRNSGVIHSGLYYRPGSLKAAACVRGNRLLYRWAVDHGVWHRKVGKLVVAQRRDQIDDLERLFANARANQAPDVALITAAQVAALEPAIQAEAALLCRESGIIDPAELVLSLVAAAEEKGAHFVRGAAVTAIEVERGLGGYRLHSTRGPVRAVQVVNAAGLASDQIARLVGIDRDVIHPCRGDYFRLGSATRYQHLIYPLKDRRAPGLGIHLTLDRAGGYRLGPDATYVDRRDDFGEPPLDKSARFLAAAQHLLGPVTADQLSYDGCGIRPTLRGPNDADEKDFVLHEEPPGFVHLIGIESPGLTAALDLADRAAALLTR
jgi:L-2-hydroxyglutarate oxidase LhgO